MVVPNWIWFTFTFAFGCCIGSFLNVVIYRLPLDRSLISPGSACPACGKHICFYDNIPLISWLVLRAKCRYCKAPISPRYFVIELLTGLVCIGLFVLYFRSGLWAGIDSFLYGGWLIYLMSLILAAGFIAASAIDLQLWVIPICICWLVTAVGLIGSAVSGYIIAPAVIAGYALLPTASAATAALAAGGGIGLGISWLLLASGLVKRSYECEEASCEQGPSPSQGDESSETGEPEAGHEPPINHRLEISREVMFLLPIIICSIAAYWLSREVLPIRLWWENFSQYRVVAGFLGSVWGYFVGCGVVWSARILGTLGFGKEAMGLGDVHLMGAAGAVIGPVFVVVAFFMAPFFGLAWAGGRMFFKKTLQIPYGPFLSLAVFAVIILHDWILSYWNFIRYHY